MRMQHHLQVVLSKIVKRQALCSTLALIIAAALANWIDIAPIRLSLRVLQGIAIHLQVAGDGGDMSCICAHSNLVECKLDHGARALCTRLLTARACCCPGIVRCMHMPGRPMRDAAYTSLVLLRRKRARVRLARPSMFMVPMKLVLMVLMGLYLQHASPIRVMAEIAANCQLLATDQAENDSGLDLAYL